MRQVQPVPCPAGARGGVRLLADGPAARWSRYAGAGLAGFVVVDPGPLDPGGRWRRARPRCS